MLYGLIIALSAWVAVNGSALAAGRLSISLKADAAIASGSVTLKDIADVSGPEAKGIETLAQTVLCPAPVFGEPSVLSRYQVRGLLQDATGQMLPADTFTGAAAVQIRLQGRQISPDEIIPMIKAQISGKAAWSASEIEVRALENLQTIELPPVEGGFRIASRESVLGRDSILVPIEVLQSGKSVRSFWIKAEIGIRAEVVTAARQISTRATVVPADFEMRLVEIPDLRTEYIRHPEDVLGRTSRRAFRAGDPLYTEAFAEPVLVRSGEIIRLRLERSGIVITSLVKAEQDGRLGQVIRVRNVDFSAVLKAQVTGRAEVKMQ